MGLTINSLITYSTWLSFYSHCYLFRFPTWLPAHDNFELFQQKTQYKDVNGFEDIYMQSKQFLNSVYGMMVSDIINNDISFLQNGDEKGNHYIDEKATYEKHVKENRLYWGKSGENIYPRLKKFLSEMDTSESRRLAEAWDS